MTQYAFIFLVMALARSLEHDGEVVVCSVTTGLGLALLTLAVTVPPIMHLMYPSLRSESRPTA